MNRENIHFSTETSSEYCKQFEIVVNHPNIARQVVDCCDAFDFCNNKTLDLPLLSQKQG